MKAPALRRGTLFRVAAAIFFTTTASGLGPYSARFGPYWLALLLLLGAITVPLRFTQTTRAVLRPSALVGLSLFVFLWVAALVTDTGHTLGLVMPMFAQLVCFLLALSFSSRFLAQPPLGWALLPALCVLITTNLYEYFIAPQTWSIAPGRAAGFFENPNDSASILILLAFLVLASFHLVSWRQVLPILLTTLVAALVTFSRGAIVLFVALALLYYATTIRTHVKLSVSTLLGLGLFFAAVIWFVGWLSAADLSADARLRMNSMLHGTYRDDSVEIRASALVEYTQRFLGHPFFGASAFGSLVTFDNVGPHNSFVALGADFGVMPVCAVTIIIALMARGARRLRWRGPQANLLAILALWLFIASLFSHNVFYSVHGALASGLALGALPPRHVARRLIGPQAAR